MSTAYLFESRPNNNGIKSISQQLFRWLRDGMMSLISTPSALIRSTSSWMISVGNLNVGRGAASAHHHPRSKIVAWTPFRAKKAAADSPAGPLP